MNHHIPKWNCIWTEAPTTCNPEWHAAVKKGSGPTHHQDFFSEEGCHSMLRRICITLPSYTLSHQDRIYYLPTRLLTHGLVDTQECGEWCSRLEEQRRTPSLVLGQGGERLWCEVGGPKSDSSHASFDAFRKWRAETWEMIPSNHIRPRFGKTTATTLTPCGSSRHSTSRNLRIFRCCRQGQSS